MRTRSSSDQDRPDTVAAARVIGRFKYTRGSREVTPPVPPSLAGCGGAAASVQESASKLCAPDGFEPQHSDR